MSALAVNGSLIPLTHDGRLQNLDDWNEEIAKALAQADGITLTDSHWEVLHLMREYYSKFNISPIRKLLKKAITKKYGADKAKEGYLDDLFPGDVLVQGTKFAGLPMTHLDAELDPKERAEISVAHRPPEKVRTRDVKHFVGQFEFKDEVFHVSDHGNLIEHHRWTESMAEFLSAKEGITLTSDHWLVLYFLRQFYFEYGITPMVRLLMKHMKEALGPRKASAEFLYRLFPDGPSRQGSRIAGLPEPQGCID